MPQYITPLQQQRCRYTVPCASSTPEDISTSGRAADDEYMKEYAQLKNDLIGGTRKSGGVLAAYLLLTVDAEAAVAALAGAAASNAYIAWLCRDVDNVKPTDRVPMWEAEAVENDFERKFKMLLAAYWYALNPRLLVPVALAALGWAGHQAVSVSPEGVEEPLLDSFHQACLLLGFLCYKVPLFLRVGDANVPKGYNSEESGRPMIYRVEDTLDQWGRPKKSTLRMPTEALPEQDRESLPQVDVGEELDGNAKVTEGILQSIRRSAMSVLPFSREQPAPNSLSRDSDRQK